MGTYSLSSFTPFCVSGRPGEHAWVLGTKNNYCSKCGLILEITGLRKGGTGPRYLPARKISKKKSKVARLRARVAERDGNECWWCIAPGTEADPLTLEHVPRLAKGGNWDLENLRLAHRSCNERRPVLDKLEESR